MKLATSRMPEKHRPIERSLFLILIFACFTGLAPALAAQTSLALPYLEAGLQAEAQGRNSDALALARRGLELDGQMGELWFLEARCLENLAFPGSRKSLETALSAERFAAAKRREAQVWYYRILQRQGRGKAAFDHLRLNASSALVLEYPDLLTEAIRIFRNNGAQAKADSLLAEGLQRHPTHLPLQQLALEQQPGLMATALLLLERTEARNKDWISLLAAYCQRLPRSAERLAWLEKLAGHRPLTIPELHLALEDRLALAKGEGDRQRARDAVLAGLQALPQPWDGPALLRLQSTLAAGPAEALLQNVLMAAQVELFRDETGDGFPEDRFLLSYGQLKRWVHDGDQDWQPEAVSTWEGGRPRMLEAFDPASGRRWQVRYGLLYPWAASTRLANGPTVLDFHHGYRALEDRFVDLPAWQNPAQPPALGELLSLRYRPEHAPSEALLLESSWKLELSASAIAGRRDLRRGWLSSWTPLELPLPLGGIDERANGDWFASHGRVAAEFRLQGGMLRYGRADEDGDGTFDHAWLYRDGKARFGFLRVGDEGGFEAIEDLDKRQVVDVLVDGNGWTWRYDRSSGIARWDLDADGLVNVAELLKAHRELWDAVAVDGGVLFDLLDSRSQAR